MSAFNVAIIVPVLNEIKQVHKLMERLRLLQDDWVNEIILVDGGSTDGCDELLKNEFKLIYSEKGRAKQMNAGAKMASSTWLFFLHADTQLSISHIKAAVDQSALHQWGRFNVRLSGGNFMFCIIERFINLRSFLTSVCTGDQTIFIRKKTFEKLNGFATIKLMEDVEISKRLKKHSKPLCIKNTVVTSSRRWQEYGIYKTIWLMWKLRFFYWCGIPADKLAKLYR